MFGFLIVWSAVVVAIYFFHLFLLITRKTSLPSFCLYIYHITSLEKNSAVKLWKVEECVKKLGLPADGCLPVNCAMYSIVLLRYFNFSVIWSKQKADLLHCFTLFHVMWCCCCRPIIVVLLSLIVYICFDSVQSFE